MDILNREIVENVNEEDEEVGGTLACIVACATICVFSGGAVNAMALATIAMS